MPRAAVANFVLPFEAPFVELQERVRELRAAAERDPSLLGQLATLEVRAGELARDVFSQLSPIEKVQLARHPMRPYTSDYLSRLCTDLVELAGDRRYGEDASIVAGLARFRGRSVAVVGQQKGRNTKENVRRNFGMPNPEGYRKADRVYQLADRFRLPIVTFIDTPGAYPGIGGEERGQGEAIGACLYTLACVEVPVVAIVIGEGGSGGALALGVANRVMMLEYAWYSVISPEGCAAILWKDGARAADAAAQLKLTASDLSRLGVVERVIDEPAGGAHQDHERAASLVGDALEAALEELSLLSPAALRDDRYQRFRRLGDAAIAG